MKARLPLLLVLLTLVAAPRALAAEGMLVGVDDDSLKWYARPQALVAVYRDLGLDAVRVTLDWRPGAVAPTATDRTTLSRVNVATWGARVVLAVGGPAGAPPRDARARDEYCSYVAGVLRRYPAFNDIVVWTEPNSATFWRPQTDAPSAYEALLARCWDVLHAVRPGVNVIAASAPHRAPADWFRNLGAAFRASGRRAPLFDTVGHNAYPETSAEPPAAKHRNGSLDEGDYDKLVATLRTAFAGTAQRISSIWYMEDGFQSTVASSRRLYTGAETDRHAVSEETQAKQLEAAIRLALCQPLVGAFFNFELRDETSLGGWQSGVLRADWSAKPAASALSRAAAAVHRGRVVCATRIS